MTITLRKLKEQLEKIKAMDFVKTHRAHDTGIGKTLEDLLEIKEYNLHSTVYGSRKNPQSFKVVFEGEKLVLKNKSKIVAYWPISIFDNVLKAKSDNILLAFAETKGDRKTKNEKFHFTEAYLLSNLNINKFRSAVESDKLKIEISIGVYRSGKNKGKYHDHCTGFRINKRDFLHLFDNFTQII